MDLSTIPALSAGTTPGVVDLRRATNGTFVLAMVGNENRFTMELAKALHLAFDIIEDELAKDKKGAPAALLAMSTSPKFFSNGIDPAWNASPDRTKEELAEWISLVMPSFARPILLPIPTICAIGGHAIGAGLMFALGFDYRIQARGKGFLCAIEIAIGIGIPEPELTLFRHDMPANAFHETVLSARRWGADDALRAGIIHQACDADKLLTEAFAYCEKQGKTLAKSRTALRTMKLQTKGYVAKEIFEYNNDAIELTRSALPARLLQHHERFMKDAAKYPSVFPWASAKL